MFFRCISMSFDRIRVVFSPILIIFEYALNAPSTFLRSRREVCYVGLGAFMPQAQVHTLTLIFTKMRVIRSTRIPKWGRSAKTRHESNQNSICYSRKTWSPKVHMFTQLNYSNDAIWNSEWCIRRVLEYEEDRRGRDVKQIKARFMRVKKVSPLRIFLGGTKKSTFDLGPISKNWISHKVSGWITILLTVRWSETDKNSLSYLKNSLGAFMPQGHVHDIAEWFWEMWVVHLKVIQNWLGSAKTRHESDKKWLQGTASKWSRLSFSKTTKNAKKRKRAILIRLLP